MKKKVSSVKFQEDFPSQYGHFYKWLIEFQDGFQAEYLSKTETQNKFVEGQDVDVEISTRDYNGKKINKVKPVSNFQGGSRQAPKADNVQELIVKQNALTNEIGRAHV